MIFDLADLASDVEVDGELVRRSAFSRVLEGRGWATVVLGVEERAADGAWRPKLQLVRLRRAGEGWKKHAAVTLPADQVQLLMKDLAQHAALFVAGGDDGHDDDA